MNDKVISLLGLAERAGKIASGEFAAEKAVKTGKARLIIVAEDASDNTKKKFSDIPSPAGMEKNSTQASSQTGPLSLPATARTLASFTL